MPKKMLNLDYRKDAGSNYKIFKEKYYIKEKYKLII